MSRDGLKSKHCLSKFLSSLLWGLLGGEGEREKKKKQERITGRSAKTFLNAPSALSYLDGSPEINWFPSDEGPFDVL